MEEYHCLACHAYFFGDSGGNNKCPICERSAFRVAEAANGPTLGNGRPIYKANRIMRPEKKVGGGNPTGKEVQYRMYKLRKKDVKNGAGDVEYWTRYSNAMRYIVLNADTFSEEKKSGWVQAIKGFHDALTAHGKDKDSDVYVAATLQKGDCLSALDMDVKIEMCMTVTASKYIPFTSHMGIFRTPLRNMSAKTIKGLKSVKKYGVGVLIGAISDSQTKWECIPGISGSLHAFAAKSCKGLYNKPPKYMITAPLKKMLEIMLEQYGDHAKREIEVTKSKDKKTVFVRVEKETLSIGMKAWQSNTWVRSVADLEGERPKIAIKLQDMIGGRGSIRGTGGMRYST